MGYTLAFYSLQWKDLSSAFRGDQPAIYAEVLKGPGGSLISGEVGRELERQGALRDLLGGDMGRRLAGHGPEPPHEKVVDATAAQATAFLALVQQLGDSAGEMVHNSKAGPAFRDHFLGETLPSVLGPFNWYYIADRPLFGFTYPGYPTWGGLRASECEALCRGRDLDDLPELENTDEEDWLYSVAAALSFAQLRRTDLVTLYY